jgi:hypothetical protein
MLVQPSIEAYEGLLKKVKALEEENKRLRNEKKETSIFAAEVELQSKTRDRKASRNSWAEIYNEATTLRKHKKLMGQEVETDDSLEWRVKWGQRGVGVCLLLGLICWVARQNIAFIVCGALGLLFAGLLYYKNVSLVIAKRLLREMNVIIILVFGLCNCLINIVEPRYSLEPVMGLIYILVVAAIVFLDALKRKSRVFVIVVGILFVLINITLIHQRIFGDWDQGVVLLQYSIQGNKYNFMKRSVKRSIYIQIVLFSLNGIYTIFKDKKQELMIFATGHIYRETGTASKDTCKVNNI